MKIGVLFSGQGSQYPGMGSDLYENYKAAREVFNLAGDEIKSWCFDGTKEDLRKTHITQPSVYTVTLAAYNTLLDELKKADIDFEIVGAAGFSMGEYAALTAAGIIDDLNTGIEIIKKRGEFMTEAGTDSEGKPKGSMAAVFGKRDKILTCVDELREDDILEAVNFNSPIQTAVAGDIAAVDRLKARGKKEFGLKVIPLSVSTAFHCSMMDPAAEKLEVELDKYSLNEPTFTVYSNTTGKDIMEGEHDDSKEWIKSRLALQAKSPVYWQETIENMSKDGVEFFIEVGPGKTLTGFAGKIVKDIPASHVEDRESLERTIRLLKN